MAMSMYELAKSRDTTVEIRTGEITQSWMLLGSDTTDPDEEQTVYAFVIANTVEAYWTWQRKRVKNTPLGGGVWTVDVTYGVADPLTNDFNWDTTGGTEHITQSLSTLFKIKAGGGAAPSFKRAIGVTREAVAGVDRTVPKLEFQLTRNYLFVTWNYLKTLYFLSGSTNNGPWYGFDTGELLFLGASGQNGQNGIRRITYRFAASPNQRGPAGVGP